MSRTDKMGLFASVAAVALMFGSAPVSANHHVIGAVDNITPEPPSDVAGEADLGVPSVSVTWTLSPSEGSDVVTTNGGATQPTGDNVVLNPRVTEYIVYRDDAEIARVPAGQGQYIDTGVESGGTYDYSVSAFDGTNESDIADALDLVTLGAAPSVSVSLPDGLVDFESDGETFSFRVFNNGPGEATVRWELDAPGFGLEFWEDPEGSEGVEVTPDDRYIIASGGNAFFVATFTRALVDNINGVYEETFVAVTNDPENRRIEVPLRREINDGTNAPRIDVAPVVAFGGINEGTSSTKQLKITNAGGEPLTITDIVSSSGNFVVGALPDVAIEALGNVEVDITFTADDNIRYEGTITITSNDPNNGSVDVTAFGLGRIVGEGTKPPTRKVVKARITFPISIDFTDPVAVSSCEENARANIQVNLAVGLLARNVTCTEGSTIVDFEIVAEEPEPGEDPPAITAEEGLAALIVVIEDPEVEVFPDLVDDLGAVESVVDETVTLVAPQPTDAAGDEILGWFTVTGTRVDLDDFFVFADAFGSVVDSDALDVFDIAGPSQGPPDGLINFEDFFRFADDFGKTVANATDIQAVLGG